MITVCIESPLAGDVATNVAYARACLLFCLRRDVAPFASHLLYTQVLDDADKMDRSRGMKAGFSVGDQCDERWVFTDLGISRGMKAAITRAQNKSQRVREKTLGEDWRDLYNAGTAPTVEFAEPEAPPTPPQAVDPDAPLEVE